MMKTFLSKTVVMWFKRLGFAGALRWRMLYWAYRLWPGLHIRDREWDFVCDYLPALMKRQKATVLDVGATSSLFIYELAKRGYETIGLDVRPYQEVLPEKIGFVKRDICDWDCTVAVWDPYMSEYSEIKSFKGYFNFVVCISVLEHITEQHKAIIKMANVLAPGGKLLLTIPNEVFAQDHTFEGFSYDRFVSMVTLFFHIAEYTERKGQICACLVKK